MSIPRPAATTMLLRPAGGWFEVFMLRRSARSAFMPDVYVFPGGALDAADFSERSLARVIGIDVTTVERMFRDEPGVGAHGDAAPLGPEARLGLFVTAARELYEEAGVFLTAHADGTRYNAAANAAALERLEAARPLVASGELNFAELLEELDAWIDVRAFAYFSHWITPVVEPRRFDAYFFVAVARADEQAQADASETHDGIWISPHHALERASEGTFTLMFPTIKHLERLVAFKSIDDVLAFTATKRIITVMPEIEDGPRFILDEIVALGW